MKSRLSLLAVGIFVVFSHAHAGQQTTFTYQGRLFDGGMPANGSYDLQFGLTDAATSGNQLGSALSRPAIPVGNGLFAVALDFGPDVFDGSPRWLEIAVRTNGSTSSYVVLTPRQPLTAAPYAMFANSSVNANIAGTLTDGGRSLTNIAATNLIGTIPLNRLSGLTSNQFDQATWQSATATATNTVAAIASLASGRDDLNRWSWINTLKKLYQNQPIQIMMIGDSIAEGPYLPLLAALQKVYGEGGGFGAGGSDLYNMIATPPAVEIISDQTIWFQSFCRTTNGGIVTWNSVRDTSITGNVLEVDYIAKAGAGTFKLQTNINNSVWNDVPNYTLVNANNGGAPAGVVIRITNSVALPYQIRAVGLSGSVEFPGGGIANYTRPGVIMNDFTAGGSLWNDFLVLPDAVKAPIFESWAPDLILATFRDFPDTLSGNFDAWHSFMKAHLPHTDVVWLGVCPNEIDDAYWSVLFNQVARSNAQYYGYGYFDTYHLFGSFSNGLAAGLLKPNDDIHPTATGYSLIADALLEWLALADNMHGGFLTAPAVSYYSGGDLTTSGTIDLTGNMLVRGLGGALTLIGRNGLGNMEIYSAGDGNITFRNQSAGTDLISILSDSGNYSLSPSALPWVPVNLGKPAPGAVWWNLYATNAFFYGSVWSADGFAVGSEIGITTNMNVVVPGGRTNQLRFNKGILTRIVPQ